MKNSNRGKALFVMGLLSLTMGYKGASAQESIVPEINPTSECLAGQVKVPKNFPEYRFIRDSNCKGIFVLPEPVVEPVVDFDSAGQLGVCKAVKINIDRLVDIEKSLLSLREKRSEIVEKMLETENEAEIEKMQRKIAIIDEQERKNMELRQEDKTYLDQEYGRTEGGTFNMLLDNQVKQEDLSQLVGLNITKVKKIVNGKEEIYAEVPIVDRAPVTESYYSFRLRSRTPGDSVNPSIMETDIPGLEKLKQLNAESKYTHIKAGDVIGGSFTVNLPTACEGVKEVSPGQYEMTENGKRRAFAVNRTMVVQKRFAYGYEASLKTSEMTKKIASDFVSKSNFGSKVTQVFDEDLDAYLDSFLNFEWKEEYATENSIVTSEQIMDLKKAAFARLVSDYYKSLVESGKLVPNGPSEAGEGKVVTITDFRKGWGCGPVKIKNTIFDRVGCGAYDFTLKTWYDGITKKDIETELNIGQDLREEFNAQSMAPFYYTTAFQYKKVKDGDE